MPSIDELTYVAPPSVGHEIGIMFGFLGAMALSMALYVVAWQYGNKRGMRKEQERVQALRDSGFLKEKQDGQDGQDDQRGAGDDQQEYVTDGITTM